MKSIKNDNSEWVGCDNSNCGRWTHIDCELKKGIFQIKDLLKDNSYKYHCPTCRNIKQNLNYGMKKSEKIKNIDELNKIMIPKFKKPEKNNYHYQYSDNYKGIDKLLTTYNKPSLYLEEGEMFKDLELFNKISGKELFSLKGNRRMKNFSYKNSDAFGNKKIKV